MPDQSPNLELPFILPNQAQKHVTHNEAVQQLDALVQLSVLALDATAPPINPTPGDRYGLGAGATGAWAGHDGALACYVETGWVFLTPQEGWRVWDQAAGALKIYSSNTWEDLPFAHLGVNTTADVTNRLAVKSDAALLSHDDVTPGTGDMRLVLNKSAPGQTGSLTFQSGFSGRAEIGLTGNDNLHVKVSPDGSTWFASLCADRSNGNLAIGHTNPTATLHVARPDGAKLRVEDTSASATARIVAEFSNNGRPDVVFANTASSNEWSIGAGTNLVFKSGPLGSLSSAKTTHITLDGTTGDLILGGAAVVASVTVATLPSAATAGAILFVTDETGGPVLAFADGTNWRRSTDRAVVS